MSKTYKQTTYKIRVQRGAGNPDLVSVRPTRSGKKDGAYTDTEEPTLVTFDALCQVDIPALLSIGAIEEYKAPAKRKEVADVRETSSVPDANISG